MLSGARATDIRSSFMEAPWHIEEFADCARKDVSQASRILRGRKGPRFLAQLEQVSPGGVWELARQVDDSSVPIEAQRQAVCEHHAHGNGSRPFALVHVVDRKPNVS